MSYTHPSIFIRSIGIPVILFLLVTHIATLPVWAVACAPPISGNYTITSDCAFSGTVNGVDAGLGSTNIAQLTVQSGIVTINSNQVIAFGKMVASGGSIALASDNTGALKPLAGIWMVDADADGYASTATQSASATSPGPIFKRRNTIVSLTTLDCYDFNANAHPGQTAYFSVDRGDGSFDYNCDNAVTKSRLNCTCGCGNGCPATPVCAVTVVTTATACGTTNVNAGPSACSRGNDIYGNCTSCAGSGTTYTILQCH